MIKWRKKRFKNFLLNNLFFLLANHFVLAQLPFIMLKENICLKKKIWQADFKLPYETFKYYYLNDTLSEMKFTIFKGVPEIKAYMPGGLKEANLGTIGFNWTNPKYYGEGGTGFPFAKLLSFVPIPRFTLPKIFPAKK